MVHGARVLNLVICVEMEGGLSQSPLRGWFVRRGDTRHSAALRAGLRTTAPPGLIGWGWTRGLGDGWRVAEPKGWSQSRLRGWFVRRGTPGTPLRCVPGYVQSPLRG